MIVDCHTHWGTVWEDRYREDATAWLEVLDRYGIDKAIIMGHYSLKHSEEARADNDRLARIRDRHPEHRGRPGLTGRARCDCSSPLF